MWLGTTHVQQKVVSWSLVPLKQAAHLQQAQGALRTSPSSPTHWGPPARGLVDFSISWHLWMRPFWLLAIQRSTWGVKICRAGPAS